MRRCRSRSTGSSYRCAVCRVVRVVRVVRTETELCQNARGLPPYRRRVCSTPHSCRCSFAPRLRVGRRVVCRLRSVVARAPACRATDARRRSARKCQRAVWTSGVIGRCWVDTDSGKPRVSDTHLDASVGVRHPSRRIRGCQTPILSSQGCLTPISMHLWVSDTVLEQTQLTSRWSREAPGMDSAADLPNRTSRLAPSSLVSSGFRVGRG